MITTMVKKISNYITFAPITFIETHKRNRKLNPPQIAILPLN